MDFDVMNCGSIFMLTPRTLAAQNWAEANLDPDAQKLGHSIAIEHRYIANIVDGIQADGLTVGD